MCDAAERGDLAAGRSLIEEQGRDVNEKDDVRYITVMRSNNDLTRTRGSVNAIRMKPTH